MMYLNNYYENNMLENDVILFGASELGSRAVNYVKKINKNILFLCDNDKKKQGMTLDKIIIKSPENLINIDKNMNILISSSYYQQIGKQLVDMGFVNIYYYIDNVGIEKFEAISHSPIENKCMKEILKNVSRISFELSNLCNYAAIHKKCPLSTEKQHTILPTKIVEDVLDELSYYNFDGTIAFHRYNEPLIDPRLFMLIKYAKKKCSNSKIFILSNGYYLNQDIADELICAGVSKVNCTAYTPSEFERLSKLNLNIPYRVFEGNLDDRLEYYEENNQEDYIQPCYAPLNEIIITKNGEVGLCCLDWSNNHTFGDLNSNTLENILLNSNIMDVYNELYKGNRKFNICKNCRWTR